MFQLNSCQVTQVNLGNTRKGLQQLINMGQQETLSPIMTVVGMVNGMIGGLILILPVLALNAGYILSFIIILLTGVFSYYSCYLCVIHMGDQPDLDFAILRHFNGNKAVKIFYDLCVWSNLMLIDMLYFELIMMQWEGLVFHEEYPIFNPVSNAIALFALVFVLKYFEFGASVMAYGIISIATYLLFLIWVVSTSNQGNQTVEYQAFGSGAVIIAAAMGQAFSIQSFFIPVLKKNPNPEKYIFYTMLAYVIGGCAYFYIAYMGSFGILHRFGGKDPQTIQDYFSQGAWEVKIIQAIYLVHLYSVFPQFLLISKKRLFNVIRIEQSKKGFVSLPEIIYFIFVIGVCFIIGYYKINVNDIISINGAVIGFFFIYFLPAILHLKCVYFSKGKRPIPKIELKISQISSQEGQQRKPNQSQIEIQTRVIENDNGIETPLFKDEKKQRKQSDQVSQSIQLQKLQIQNSFYYCDCEKTPSSSYKKNANIILIIIMVLLGAFILVNGVYSVAK